MQNRNSLHLVSAANQLSSSSGQSCGDKAAPENGCSGKKQKLPNLKHLQMQYNDKRTIHEAPEKIHKNIEETQKMSDLARKKAWQDERSIVVLYQESDFPEADRSETILRNNRPFADTHH
ncbi:hypothetical protein [Succinimonas sp.]|uniref:hypothetical protein n=1 Tax=Succinimonas sp. TaxID=1936151 RepID=UPI003865A226